MATTARGGDSALNYPTMKRYWIEFTLASGNPLVRRFGVTAYALEDALVMLQKQVFANNQMPTPSSWVENIDVSTLDAEHILPNMESPSWRGIWYPMGFSQATL